MREKRTFHGDLMRDLKNPDMTIRQIARRRGRSEGLIQKVNAEERVRPSKADSNYQHRQN